MVTLTNPVRVTVPFLSGEVVVFRDDPRLPVGAAVRIDDVPFVVEAIDALALHAMPAGLLSFFAVSSPDEMAALLSARFKTAYTRETPISIYTLTVGGWWEEQS